MTLRLGAAAAAPMRMRTQAAFNLRTTSSLPLPTPTPRSIHPQTPTLLNTTTPTAQQQIPATFTKTTTPAAHAVLSSARGPVVSTGFKFGGGVNALDRRSGFRATFATEAASSSVESATSPVPGWVEGTDIRLLYDSECWLCMREVEMLKGKDAKQNKIHFVDIASDDYDQTAHADIDWETAMGSIHAIKKDGEVINGVRVFREVYEAVGLGWVYGFTKVPYLMTLAEKVYDFWAEYRLPVTGRPPLAVVLEARRQRLGGVEHCDLDKKNCGEGAAPQ